MWLIHFLSQTVSGEQNDQRSLNMWMKQLQPELSIKTFIQDLLRQRYDT